jgi:hypothetical protein
VSGITFEPSEASLAELEERIAARVEAKLRRVEPYMDADEAGRYIGSDARRIYDLARDGRLPSYRDGRSCWSGERTLIPTSAASTV